MESASEMAAGACRATGDEILVAGLFTPRPAPGAGGQLVVAVSPSRVYLLRRRSRDDGPENALALAHTFDRRRLAATIHTRRDGRTLTLEDTWTGERFELVGARTPEAHVTATMHALSDLHELAS
ncbi:MAG: hypothetical protein PV358_13565 [Acidimicrobiales bacterium]|nr:hypothetical protein [Acidimicrobiales bacterium]